MNINDRGGWALENVKIPSMEILNTACNADADLCTFCVVNSTVQSITNDIGIISNSRGMIVKKRKPKKN